MLQAIKVWALRKYYRFVSARHWRGHAAARQGAALAIPGPAGPLHARLYLGDRSSEHPLIVYFHGGGWVVGDLDTHDPFCRMLCELTGSTVIAIDYRLAPEHPYPAAPEDCLAAVRWVAAHVGDFGPTDHELVIAGDSAGGNLAACTCLALDPATRARVAGQVLIYPAVDHYDAGFGSYVEKATGQLLTSKMMFWFWDTYLGDLSARPEQATDAFPLRSGRLGTLPPTFLVTAENDPLRDEGRACADRLGAAGVPVTYRHFARAAHGFACSEGPTADFEAMMSDLAGWIEALARAVPAPDREAQREPEA